MRSFETDENLIEKIEGMTTEYPYCMHQRDLTDIVIPWHWHEELELGYIERGTWQIRTLNAEYTVHQGDGFFVNSNVMDMKKNAAPGSCTLEVNHIFHPVFLSGHFRSRFETRYLNPIIKNRRIEVHILRRGHEPADQILSNLRKLKDIQAQPDTEFAVRNLLSESWMLLMKDIRISATADTGINTESQHRLRSMISYIHTHYHEKMTLTQIADSAAVSDREALRCFRRHLQQSPFEYLISFRLNQAKKMLKETGQSVTQISYQCGFSDSAYMGRLFKKTFGMTPLAYRNMQDNAKTP